MSVKKDLTLIQYYIPEDKDDPDSPNIFAIPQNKTNLKLCHIYESFPLKGTYIFRFKYAHDGFTVWLDLPDLQSKLPIYKDKVYIKASRLSWNQSKISLPTKVSQSKNNIVDHIDLFDSNHQAKQQQKKVQVSPSPIQSNHMNILSQKHQVQTAILGGMNLFGNFQTNVIPTSNNSSSNAGLDFFGMNSNQTNNITSNKNIDNLITGLQKHGDLI